MRPISFVLCLGLLGGCGATRGTLGHGEVHSHVEMGVAGLALSEQRRLEAGPGPVSLAAVHQLVPRDASLLLRLDLLPLVSSGILEVGLAALPAELRDGLDRVVAASGVDPVGGFDGIGWWAIGGDSSDGSWKTAHMAIVAPRTSALKVLAFFEALEEELDDEDTDPERGYEVVIAAPIADDELEAVVARTVTDIKDVQRLDLANRVVLLSGRDGEHLFYACLWPGGILAGATDQFAGDIQKAAAARTRDSVAALREAVSAARAVPSGLATVELKTILKGKRHHARATIDGRVAVSYETELDAYGDPEKARAMAENWEQRKDLVLKLLDASQFGGIRSNLRALLRQLVENGELTETGDGVRAESEVDVDVVIDALKDLAP